MTFLAALALLMIPPAAAGPCPGGGELEFTGHPFFPSSCPPEAAVPAPPESHAPKPDKKSADLSPFLGRWTGIVNFANQRYEAAWELSRPAKGKGTTARAAIMNYRTHARHALSASLKPALFGSSWNAEVRLDGGASKPLKGELRLAPSSEAPFEREAWLSYKGRDGWHRLAWRLVSPDSLSFRYQDLSDGLGREGAGELARVRP